jgi:hypothetical protein
MKLALYRPYAFSSPALRQWTIAVPFLGSAPDPAKGGTYRPRAQLSP